MPLTSFRIALVGSGNLASQLGPALKKAGHRITMVVSRKKEHAARLAKKLQSPFSVSLEDVPADSDIILLAVQDGAISGLAARLTAHRALVLHTSGSTDIKALKGNKHCGVLYPVQTFSGDRKADIKKTPFLVEGNNRESLELVTKLAGTLSGRVQAASTEKRRKVHLAAVFACNFPNYLYGIAYELMKKEKLDRDLLAPLMKETLEKALSGDPHQLQTGPARRNDKITLKIHLDLLKKNKEYQHIYEMLSKAIVKKHNL